MTLEDTTNNDVLIEEMLRDAKEAPEPGAGDKIVHRGDEGQPAPMTISELTSAGWVYIYEISDGRRSVANRNMLPQLLKVKVNGKPRFTTRKPDYEPKRGTLKCLLHKDDTNREHYAELGFTTCRKSNITSPYQVTQHMRKRHPMEWATIEQERKDLERKEEREFQRSIISGARAEAPLYVSDKKPKKK